MPRNLIHYYTGVYAENGEESFLTIAGSISNALGFNGKTISLSMAEAIADFGDWA